MLAFSALRNSDKVGLILFTDQIEQYVPPKKGRRHVLRVLREILYFKPGSRGTQMKGALDFANHITRRRAVMFCISDFQWRRCLRASTAGISQALRRTNRRHDLVAVRIHDPHEASLPDVGLLAIEDAETGELLEIDTHKAQVREQFAALAQGQYDSLRGAFHAEGIDHLNLSTAQPYLAPLIQFFKSRERRRQ